jgi:hypothetical protein
MALHGHVHTLHCISLAMPRASTLSMLLIYRVRQGWSLDGYLLSNSPTEVAYQPMLAKYLSLDNYIYVAVRYSTKQI